MGISALGILFSVIAMVTMGLAVAMAKKPAQEIGVRRFVFWRQALTSTLLFITLVVSGQNWQFSTGYFALELVIAAASYIALISAYRSLTTGKIGVVAPIVSSSAIVTVLFSVAFLGESLNAAQAAAVGVTLLGIVLLSVDFSDFGKSDIFRISSGVPLALVACLVWGVTYALYKIPIAVLGPLLAAFAIEFGSFLPNVPANILTKTSFKFPGGKTTTQIIIIGILAAASTLFFNLGISVSGGEVALVAAITFSNPIVSSLYGLFVYKEKLNTRQWLALGLTVAGIIGISVF